MNDHDKGNLSYERELKMQKFEDKLDDCFTVFEHVLNILAVILLILSIAYGAYLLITKPVTEMSGLPPVACGKVGPMTILC